jgi:hypothetical protein
MNITRRASLLEKSIRETGSWVVTSGRVKEGAGVPRGSMEEVRGMGEIMNYELAGGSNLLFDLLCREIQ